MKKLIFLLLALCLWARGVNAQTQTWTSGTCTVTLVGTLLIVDGVQMDAYPNNYSAPWYNQCTNITAIVVNMGVVEIGNNAFSGCTNLTSVTLPASLSHIGNYAFSGCTNLTSVTLPASLSYIGNYAFSYCTNLTSVTLLGTAPPTLGTGVFFKNIFDNTLQNFCVSVPLGSYQVYKANSSWGNYLCTLNGYEVVFDAGDGSPAPPAQLVTSGSMASQPTSPSRTGYRFDGWYTSSDYTTQWNFSYPVTTHLTLYAKWTLRTYTITFDPNGGSVSPTSGTTNASWQLTSLPTPTRSGYTFKGWFTAASGGTQVTTSTVFTASITIYAQWITYTITLNPNGGTVSPTSATTKANGQLTSLPKPTRAGYTFMGWFTASSGGTQVTTNTMFTANTTIYAQWVLNCTSLGIGGTNILWNFCNGTLTVDGTGAIPNYSLDNSSPPWGSDDSIKQLVVGNSVTSIGNYAFRALSFWLDVATLGSGVTSIGDYAFEYNLQQRALYVNSSTPPTLSASAFANNHLCVVVPYNRYSVYNANASWKNYLCTHTISFNANGGTVSPSSRNTQGGRLSAYSLPTPTRSGYTFNGWFTAATGGTQVTDGNNGTVFLAHTTIYAQWTPYCSPINISGSSLSWNFCSGLLTIDGTGAMPNTYDDVGPNGPWVDQNLRDSITRIVVGNNVTSVGPWTFHWMNKVAEVTIGNSVTSIGNSTFCYDHNLTSVAIGSSVASIDYGAFAGCDNLRSLTVESTVPPSLGAYVFSNVHQDFCVTVPQGAYAAYQNSSWSSYLCTNTMYTVTFMMNDGTDSVYYTQSVAQGGTAIAPIFAPTREGYDFGGWYADTTNNWSNAAWNFAVDTVTNDTTLYAKWAAHIPVDGTCEEGTQFVIKIPFRSLLSGDTVTYQWYYKAYGAEDTEFAPAAQEGIATSADSHIICTVPANEAYGIKVFYFDYKLNDSCCNTWTRQPRRYTFKFQPPQ